MKLRVFLLAGLMLLAALPAAAAEPLPSCDWYQAACRASRAFIRGARYFGTTVAGWFGGLADALRGKAGIVAQNGNCEDDGDRCAPGLACLNTCTSKVECAVYEKRCVKAPAKVLVQPAYTPCSNANICASGTHCTRTCPRGASCAVSYRCLPDVTEAPVCATPGDCEATCAKRGLPPVASSALRASCAAGSCLCTFEETDPSLLPVACPTGSDDRMICPTGQLAGCTLQGCAGGTCDAPRLTCLTAPEFGGLCLDDPACRRVTCTQGAAPFCDTDMKCRCKSFETETISCTSNGQCAGISCPSGQKPACASGACACAATEQVEIACTDASQCSGDCPADYRLACVQGRCACQRTVDAGPISCQNDTECGSILCPADYQKTCYKLQCACTRTTTQ